MVFAYRFAGQQHARAPSIDPTPMGSGKGLAGLDGAGESAAILRKAGSLGKVREAALRARFGEQMTKCPCCPNSMPIDEWLGVLTLLTTEVAMVAAPKCHPRLAMALVMRHFLPKGGKATFETIAKNHSSSVDQARRHSQKIVEALKKVEAEAHDEMSTMLICAGLLPNCC
ncbi:hypothetical protein [Chitinimonas lacunae]|uniref:Mor transcription activator domain-containing protein n=1 Tax=Chitinimonas lacunae TaxID=1963018 RepID=A0ABV8MJH3_9NEIS